MGYLERKTVQVQLSLKKGPRTAQTEMLRKAKVLGPRVTVPQNGRPPRPWSLA